MNTDNSTISIHCNSCARKTNHKKICEHENNRWKVEEHDFFGDLIHYDDGYTVWELFECQGCHKVCLRSQKYTLSDVELDFSNGFDTPIYYPARNFGAHKKPDWYEEFIKFPEIRGSFIHIACQESYRLLEGKYYVAAMLTCRALLEQIAIQNSNGDKNTFKEKLKVLANKNYIKQSDVDYFNDTIYDAGSATMHREYRPKKEAVEHVLKAIEGLLYEIYIKPEQAKKLNAEIPRRDA